MDFGLYCRRTKKYMCLIIASRTGRPKEEYIRNGFANHPDGTGIAWFEKDGVHYKKGLTVEETITMSKELPVGYVIHFRWASVGGKDKSLIHPFPISKDVILRPEGTAKSVLFHNGHWDSWNNVLVNHLSSRLVLPTGKWSDTRAIAFLVSIHGTPFLNLLDVGKFIVMANGKQYAFGDFQEEDGVYYSNSSHKNFIRGGCGTGLNNGTSRVGTAYEPITPRSTRPPISQPSQPLLGDTQRITPQSKVGAEERRVLSAEEFQELREYFEKDLNSNPISVSATGGA